MRLCPSNCEALTTTATLWQPHAAAMLAAAMDAAPEASREARPLSRGAFSWSSSSGGAADADTSTSSPLPLGASSLSTHSSSSSTSNGVESETAVAASLCLTYMVELLCTYAIETLAAELDTSGAATSRADADGGGGGGGAVAVRFLRQAAGEPSTSR